MATASEETDSAQVGADKSANMLTRFGWYWFAGMAVSFGLYLLLELFDNATELTPDHSDILTYCIIAAVVIGLASAVVGFSQSRGAVLKRLVGSILGFGILGFISSMLLLGTIANIVENRIDFPPGRTQTFWALLPIQRAYRMHSRTGNSWIIQPVIWTNIDITQADYRFMLSHSGWTDKGSEPEDLLSGGYFCAKVSMQRSGEALRVLHSGSFKLPNHSIGICSEMSSKDPSLTLIS